MKKASCLVGNSSSGIREGAFIGTPVVNIGTRQNSRERHINVIDVAYDKTLIKDAIAKQVKNGKYKTSAIYGNGNAGKQIAEILSLSNVTVQKTITY